MDHSATNRIRTEKVAQPLTRLPVINTRTVYIPERSQIALVDYSDLKRDAALFLINVDTMEEEKHLLPEGTNCGHRSLTLADNDTIYVPSTTGELNAFNLNTKTFEQRATLFPGKTFLIEAYLSQSGKFYIGNYPTALITEYNPQSGEVRKFETIPRDGLGLYSMGFIDLPDGRLLVLTVGGRPGISIFDSESGAVETIYRGNPEEESRGFFDSALDDDRVLINYRDRLRVFNWRTASFEEDLISGLGEAVRKTLKVGDAHYFSGIFSGDMYRLKDGEITVVKSDFPNLSKISNFHHLGGDEFMGMGDNGLLMRFSLSSDGMVTHQIDNVTDRGMGMQFLDKVPGEDVVVGAHFINAQMFNINLETGTPESSLNKAVPNPGQINCGTTLNGKYYIGSYVGAMISEYDWREPFVPGQNPVPIATIGDEQNRPMSMVNDGSLIYIATLAEYGHLGGAISVLDPKTRDVETYRNFIPDTNPTRTLIWPKRNILVGATMIQGDCGTAEPIAPNAVAFMWDTQERKTVGTWAALESDTLRIIDISPRGVCLGMRGISRCEGNEYFLWDVENDKREIREWPIPGIFIGGLFMNHHEFYGASEHGLFVLNVETNSYQMLSETTKETGSYCGLSFTKVGDQEFLYDIEGVVVMKATIK
jgi:hypothetical protein